MGEQPGECGRVGSRSSAYGRLVNINYFVNMFCPNNFIKLTVVV